MTPEQETALITRFVRLAPAERCVTAAGGAADSITGTAANVVQVYEFACRSPESCSGWVLLPGRPATRYAMRYVDGAWQFDSDRRILAE